MEVAFFKRYPGKVFKHKQCIFRIVFAEYLKCGKKPSFTKMEPKSKKGKANANAAKKNAENTIAENAFVLI